MLIKKLIIENLRSYKTQEINFPRGSILLSGDIGSGKTTILLAVEFALFGLQPGQKGASLLRNGEDEARVMLEFEIENKNIIIERTLKRERKSITQDYTAITIDNETFEESVTEIKNRILKILNYPPEFSKKTNLLYKFTVYTPQEEMKQIILEPGDIRLNTLRHVFGIDKYKRIEENTSILTSRLREKIRINEGMYYNLDSDKESLKRFKDNLIDLKEKQKISARDYEKFIVIREEKENSLKDIQEKNEEKRTIENEKSKISILSNEKKRQRIILENTIKSLSIQINEAKKISFNKEEYGIINERIQYQQNKEDELQKDYIEIIGKIKAEESRKREAELLKAKISGMTKCPTCLQEVTVGYKNNISIKTDDEIEKIRIRINELSLKKNQINEQIEPAKKQKEELKKRKSELELLKIKLENVNEKEDRMTDLEKQKDSLILEIENLDKHSKTLEKSILEYKKYEKIFEEKNNELKEAKFNENRSTIRNAELNKEIQFLDEKIKDKKSDIDTKEIRKKDTELLRELEYWISKKFLDLVLFTEKQVMLTLKEEFSRLFSKWFSTLVSDSLSAKLDDEFSPIIEHQDYELDYSFLSGGERTAIALAYRLALNQIINSMLSNLKTGNLVILDEPTDGFSSQQLDKMSDVLRELNLEQLILVSHEQKIEGFVDNIIHVRKEGGITLIEN